MRMAVGAQVEAMIERQTVIVYSIDEIEVAVVVIVAEGWQFVVGENVVILG